MNRIRLSLVLIFTVPVLFAGPVLAAQSQADYLRERIAEYEREEARLRGLIGANRGEQQSLQREINGIVGQINYMQSQIESTDAKIELTSLEIDDIEDRISETQKGIDKERATIGNLIAIRDQQDRESLVANLLRFADLSDFFQQVHDAVTVHERLATVVVELTGYRTDLEEQKVQLGEKVATLEELSSDQEHQKVGLGQAKYAKDRVLAETKGEESAYQTALTEIEKQKQAFFIELQQIEKRIIAGGNYIVHIEASGVPAGKVFSSPESSGYVPTQSYGWTNFASRGAYGGQIHNGYDISGGYGTPIRSIGAGVVVANGTSDGWGNWVAIRHPAQHDIVSVYGHMSSFAGGAIVGTNVTSSTVIGYEGSTGFSTGSHLHLSLYKRFFTFKNDRTGQLSFNYSDTINPASYVNF